MYAALNLQGLSFLLYDKRRFGRRSPVPNAFGAHFVPANFESQTARLFERPSEQSSKRTGNGEGGRGGIVCMAGGILIAALSPRQRMLPNATFPLFQL